VPDRVTLMTQLTIRRLDQTVIDGLKKRAAAAGRSMEEEARQILKDAIIDEHLQRQREGLERLIARRKQIFGDRVFSDSTEIIRKMRDERTEISASWWPEDAKKK
jgi:plasmid stability protein